MGQRDIGWEEPCLHRSGVHVRDDVGYDLAAVGDGEHPWCLNRTLGVSNAKLDDARHDDARSLCCDAKPLQPIEMYVLVPPPQPFDGRADIGGVAEEGHVTRPDNIDLHVGVQECGDGVLVLGG